MEISKESTSHYATNSRCDERKRTLTNYNNGNGNRTAKKKSIFLSNSSPFIGNKNANTVCTQLTFFTWIEVFWFFVYFSLFSKNEFRLLYDSDFNIFSLSSVWLFAFFSSFFLYSTTIRHRCDGASMMPYTQLIDSFLCDCERSDSVALRFVFVPLTFLSRSYAQRAPPVPLVHTRISWCRTDARHAATEKEKRRTSFISNKCADERFLFSLSLGCVLICDVWRKCHSMTAVDARLLMAKWEWRERRQNEAHCAAFLAANTLVRARRHFEHLHTACENETDRVL